MLALSITKTSSLALNVSRHVLSTSWCCQGIAQVIRLIVERCVGLMDDATPKVRKDYISLSMRRDDLNCEL